MVRQILRIGGLAFSITCLLAILVAPAAYAQNVAPQPGSSPSPSPSPSPSGSPAAAGSPTPAPTPTAKVIFTLTLTPTPSAPPPTATPSPAPSGPGQYVTVKGGPIHFTIEGNLSLGANSQQASYGGVVVGITPTPSASPASPVQLLAESNNSTTSQSAGMSIDLNRRTATTVTDIRVPFTIGTGSGGSNTQFGTVTAFYSTPQYTIAYAAQPLTLFGQLPLGSTLRGVAFIYPTAFGDVTFFEGPTVAAQGEIIKLYGVRARTDTGKVFYEFGYTGGDGYDTGHSRTLTFGLATSRGALSLIAEGAWQTRTDGDGDPRGLGGQIEIADGSSVNEATLTMRHLPEEFVAYGAGEIYGDNYVDANVHRGFGLADVVLDASYEDIGDSLASSSIIRQGSLLYSAPLGHVGTYGLNLQTQANVTPGTPQAPPSSYLSNLLGLQLGANFAGFSSTFLGQFTRAIQQPGPTQSFRSLGGVVERQLGKLNLTGTLFSQRTTQDPGSPETQTLYGLGLARQFGVKTTIALSASVTHTISTSSDAIQHLPLVTVTRQLSPAISAQASLGYQTTMDRLNPASDGHSRVFNFQINAPFIYGNGMTTGHADPHLPATILGRVQLAVGGQNLVSGFASAGPANGGLSNVQVILDDKYLQRTDLTGDFAFAFVTPGQHQLRIESSSIPRGMTVDIPVATLTVQGGQTAQLTFQVGNFGGILGKVIGLDENGNPAPLGNVSLRLGDLGGKTTQTDSTGAFGFGGLAPGEYSVEIIENTVPANASFNEAELTQKILVHSGGYSSMTFKAEPLGSIEGTILYGPEMLPNLKGAVPNAYVVAEPGEHAAIDDEDGSYIIDNLPAGDYAVSVDPETLSEGLGSKPETIQVHLGPGEHAKDINFTAGSFEKKVVFSFLGGGAASAATVMRLKESRLPPNGTTEVDVTAPETAKSVVVTSFNNTLVPLTYDKSRKEWFGEIAVPADAREGQYPIDAAVTGGTSPAGVTINVDPKMPLAIITYTPAHPNKGDTVLVHARFLVDAKEGDKIVWEDGQTTILGKPITGRVFTFDLRISLRPLHGALLTKRGSLPIELL